MNYRRKEIWLQSTLSCGKNSDEMGRSRAKEQKCKNAKDTEEGEGRGWGWRTAWGGTRADLWRNWEGERRLCIEYYGKNVLAEWSRDSSTEPHPLSNMGQGEEHTQTLTLPLRVACCLRSCAHRRSSRSISARHRASLLPLLSTNTTLTVDLAVVGNLLNVRDCAW